MAPPARADKDLVGGARWLWRHTLGKRATPAQQNWPSHISDSFEESSSEETSFEGASALSAPPPPTAAATSPDQDLVSRPLAPTERLITILGTNDIHGAIETDANGKGGMALWAGIVQSIRQGLARSHPGQAAVVLLDGGDQYQGTLISSHTEGQTIIQEMRLIGYDGVVPGNHDYDFGPLDPPVPPGAKPIFNDQVFGPIDRNDPTKDPRGVIRLRAQDLKPPLDPRNPPLMDNIFVSANTFLVAGLVDTQGRRVAIKDPQGCVPTNPAQVIDFTRSAQPNEGYILPFRILPNRAGLTVAVIGLDTHETPSTTDISNISDLCFADEATAYAAVRARIEMFVRAGRIPRPDLFFIATHNGDSATGPSTFLKPLLDKLGSSVDAVIAGHTHQSNRVVVGNVHAIQSGANGQHFGRIDLIFDTAQKKVVAAQSANFIEFSTQGCDPKAARYCQVSGGSLLYEGVPVQPVAVIDQLTRQARAALGTLPQRQEGIVQGVVKPDRIRDSALGEVFTDAMRSAFPGAQIAINNNGGLRTPMPPLVTAATRFPLMLTFDDLFRLLPFNNHVMRGKIPAKVLVAALTQAAQTCGQFPGLSFSGIQATYRRNCAPGNSQVDPQAVLLSARVGSIDLTAAGAPDIDTLAPDFLADGGDTYLMFRGQPWQDTGIVLREALADLGASGGIDWNHPIDHRWKNVNTQQDP
jgi:5'-nucleotidase